MSNQQYELGLIGLGTMGQNLLMNMADSQYDVAGYDEDSIRVEVLVEIAKDYRISGKYEMDSVVAVLKNPRVGILLVPAGQIVDSVISEVLRYLAPGDIVIDGETSR